MIGAFCFSCWLLGSRCFQTCFVEKYTLSARYPYHDVWRLAGLLLYISGNGVPSNFGELSGKGWSGGVFSCYFAKDVFWLWCLEAQLYAYLRLHLNEAHYASTNHILF